MARTRVCEATLGGNHGIVTLARMGLWGLVDLTVQTGGSGRVAELVADLQGVIRVAPRGVPEMLAEVTLDRESQPIMEPLPWLVRFDLVNGAREFRGELANRRDEVAG